ncbi:hypothetical protein ACFQ58_08635 [Agromyces sp. NPDC056523]|uniref:hypothetical protein n=1 Tax=Agromyces sp. NPDC056523 TaxID=3345850 RepID=UPI00366A5636
MNNDVENLHQLNIEIGNSESVGDRNFFERILAPVFAMRRANGTHETRDTFLANVKEGGPRSTTILSIALLGTRRAAVSCVVELDGKQYENYRVFVRTSPSDPWTLLSWANEAIGPGELADRDEGR